MAPHKLRPRQRLEQLIPHVGGTVRISQRRVPHLVTQRNGVPVSICWFAKSKTYRVFSPYQVGAQQTKTDFGDEESLKLYFNQVSEDGAIANS